MTKLIDRTDRLDPLIRDALAWITLLKSGDATVVDANLLTEWVAQSPAHQRAFHNAVRCWIAIGDALNEQPQADGDDLRRSVAGTPAT